jgi:hypothetical protein
MFEPENEIERMLVLAVKDPAARPAFARALMDAEIFLVLIPEGPLATDADGRTTVPEGTRMKLPNARRGDQAFIPFFSARSRARVWFKGDHVITSNTTRDLFRRYPATSFVLNPGSEFGKEFVPEEIERHLAGSFENYQTEIIQKPQQVLLAHPKEKPVDLIAALARELGASNSVHAAYLMYAMREGSSEPSWMLGVDHVGSWDDVRAAIGRAVAGDVLNGQMLDATPLRNCSFADTLRTGIPVIAANAAASSKHVPG